MEFTGSIIDGDFYTYYGNGLAYLGMMCPFGLYIRIYPIEEWLRVLEEEKKEAIASFTPIPEGIIKSFE